MQKLQKIAIVGSPNVGKSALFNAFTGQYIVVSNYPGTTVEVSRGRADIFGTEYEIIDTPGMYSLMPITEEERVARSILIAEMPEIVIHIVDAKNLERMLPLTLQLIEASLPIILVLNMMDEARQERIIINSALLEKELKIPVVETIATKYKGVEQLKKRIKAYAERL